jgi:hypothetical protein
VTAGEAAECEKCTRDNAVAFDCLDCVVRAGRAESTMRADQWTDHVLVSTDKPDEELTHIALPMDSQALLSTEISREFGVSGGTRRQVTTISTGGRRTPFSLNVSRARRFSRLRCTEPGTARLLMAKPSRGYPLSFGRTSRTKPPALYRVEDRKTSLYSRDLTSRRARGRSFLRALCTFGGICRRLARRRLRRQTDSAFGSPGAQNLTTVPGCVAGAKPVSTSALDQARLEGAFHIGLCNT